MRPAAFVIAALFLPAAVAAQEPPIKVGEGVRFWTTQSRIATYGTLTRWEADSFAIADNWIPITSVTMLDVHRGQKTSVSTVAKGAVIGAGGVAAITLVVLAVAHVVECTDLSFSEPKCSEGFWQWDLGNGLTLLGAIGIGAGVGLVGGALIGATRKRARWVPVQLDQLHVSFVPQHDGRLGLGVSVRF